MRDKRKLFDEIQKELRFYHGTHTLAADKILLEGLVPNAQFYELPELAFISSPQVIGENSIRYGINGIHLTSHIKRAQNYAHLSPEFLNLLFGGNWKKRDKAGCLDGLARNMFHCYLKSLSLSSESYLELRKRHNTSASIFGYLSGNSDQSRDYADLIERVDDAFEVVWDTYADSKPITLEVTGGAPVFKKRFPFLRSYDEFIEDMRVSRRVSSSFDEFIINYGNDFGDIRIEDSVDPHYISEFTETL